MASQELKDLLNEAISRELRVSIQYMWQHVVMKGAEAKIFGDELRKISIGEMKHAEEVAERLTYLGGTPTTQLGTIDITGHAIEMVEKNLKEEEKAIDLYKEIIKKADEEGDSTTRLLFEKILADEESHHGEFLKLLGK